jgi:pimeloyl-ACP methyl ester carboxylesterase
MEHQKKKGRVAGKSGRRVPALPITLVGHSMGTIVINQILHSYPEIELRNIVYMAAAASVGETADAIYPYLAAHPQASFYSLMLHPYADRGERSLYGLFPSGSLLWWIDEMFGNPVTRTDRTVGKWENVADLIYKVPPELADERGASRVHVTVFGFDRKCGEPGADPDRCDPYFDHPVRHADFSKRDYWDPIFWGER